MNNKVLKNALMIENLYRLTRLEKHEIVNELLKNKSQRELAKELNIPKSTIHDWASLRQDNKGINLHVSLALIYRKLKNLKPEEVKDWGRLEMIKEECERLLRGKTI